MGKALKARVAVLAMCMATVWTPASAHQSLAPHEHPHSESLLLGLDFILIIALASVGLMALAVAARRWTARGKVHKPGTTTNSRGWQ